MQHRRGTRRRRSKTMQPGLREHLLGGAPSHASGGASPLRIPESAVRHLTLRFFFKDCPPNVRAFRRLRKLPLAKKNVFSCFPKNVLIRTVSPLLCTKHERTRWKRISGATRRGVPNSRINFETRLKTAAPRDKERDDSLGRCDRSLGRVAKAHGELAHVWTEDFVVLILVILWRVAFRVRPPLVLRV